MLRLATAVQQQFASAAVESSIGREGELCLASSARNGADGEPLRSSGNSSVLAGNPFLWLESPVAISCHRNRCVTTINGKRHKGRREAYLIEIGGIVVVGATHEHGQRCNERRN